MYINALPRTFYHTPMAPLRQRYRHLPLISSPLEPELYCSNNVRGGFDDESQVSCVSPQAESKPTCPESPRKRPIFRKKEETSSIELFYDLFFVANLTSFTSIHPIDDRKSKLIFSAKGFTMPEAEFLL